MGLHLLNKVWVEIVLLFGMYGAPALWNWFSGEKSVLPPWIDFVTLAVWVRVALIGELLDKERGRQSS